MRMSPTLNGSSALQCFERGNAIEVRESSGGAPTLMFLLAPICGCKACIIA